MERLFQWLEQDEALKEASSSYENGKIYGVYGLGGSAKSAYAAHVLAKTDKNAVIVVPTTEQVNGWLTDLQYFSPQLRVYTYPLVQHTVFTTTTKSLELAAKQMEALTALRGSRQAVVVATAEEAAQFVTAPQKIDDAVLSFKVGEDYERETILSGLVSGGYERSDLVDRRGLFSVRGDIIDIYPLNEKEPIRLEFFGDTLENIRYFNEQTQKSSIKTDSVRILPFALAYDKDDEKTTLLDYGNNGIIIWDEGNRIKEELKKSFSESIERKNEAAKWRLLAGEKRTAVQLVLSLLAQSVSELKTDETVSITSKTVAGFRKEFTLLKDELGHWRERDYRIIFVISGEKRAASLNGWLKQNEFYALSLTENGKDTGIFISSGEIRNGFEFPYAKTVVIAEKDIYGTQKKRLRRHTENGQEINAFTDLHAGDYVVHDTHGIGKYVGIKTIETDGVHKDYLEIHYSGHDVLYVPTDQIQFLQRYIGNEGEAPRLSRMGGADWKKARAKAQKSIDNLAEKLVALYAKREITDGYAFPPDTPFQQEFEEAFPYEETQDQLKAVAAIKESMEKPVPMDCLVCGDVGFGKTEVAVRAAFKAVMGGKQVAVLVPTTVLAQQHYQTFSERFRSFGVVCDVLNRFRSIKERKEILQKVEAGQIDVLIGTHSILNKNVKFKDAGLLIVDEEQRFGVAQKEKWKTWATGIDVLTLSATPIPRTLHMSLVHLRQMCLIETPPTERLPVQTYVTEYDGAIVRDAIMREKRRGGQVFFVYNRVATMERMKVELEALVPEVTIGMAHGQMTGSVLEANMFDFYEGEYDVLLCSSLVENGLDIANANTIIVYDADRFGLSQLYQMRGRVGRSHRTAYAYFLYRRNKILNEVAEKRLQAVKEFTELGSGFKIAMRDLEIRGAGNLLGREQHGNIAGVGFVMYVQMLEEAVNRLRNEGYTKTVDVRTTLEVRVDAFIDDTYIEHGGQKIEMYQRLALVRTEEALEELKNELTDRFGKPTRAVQNLLKATHLRIRAQKDSVLSVSQKGIGLEFRWKDEVSAPRTELFEPVLRKRCKKLPGLTATFRFDMTGIDDVLAYIEYILKAYEKQERMNG
ncbi:transcription-repair coupling factor [Megasphaera micronuciformis]|uniref:Transcription-repair-coupling factor n=1 Tax=Megasphaera micronuciformis F0359 TaxID=706434 RepID=E2ZD68_9FIRM|nr:transcription-repair coupling factor [Megasphaera micronuciformis]EFQ03734.1 transcription-repair coupling factor [Megasphaera micronuciformis F0359]